jgi:hypothetical protein
MAISGLRRSAGLLIVGVAAASMTGCGEPNSASQMDTANASVEATTADAERVARLEAQERELAAREAELAMKEREQELARREAELLAKESAHVKKTAATTPKPASSPTKVATAPAPAPKAPEKVVQQPIVIPAGTQLSIGLSSAISSKTAIVGDPVDARLTSDLMVNGRRAVAAGSPVRGWITEVVSGSAKIGGTPTLVMNFDRVELDNGTTLPISGRLIQQAASDTAKDTAKIVGGAAAGAVIGHQIDHDKGKVIGGLLGGAAGAVVAKKTGSEVVLPAGTVLVVALDAPIEVAGI